MSLDNTNISLNIQSTLNQILTLQNASSPLTYAKAIGMTSGTGASQADKIYAATRTLAASTSEDLDLAGVLTDALGNVITLARVKLIAVFASGANANNVLLGGVANGLAAGPILPQTTGTVTVRPGGFAIFAAPDATAYAVTGGTGDLLHVANSGAGTSVTYDVIIIGSSA